MRDRVDPGVIDQDIEPSVFLDDLADYLEAYSSRFKLPV